jgi:hypothetical protein
LLRGTYVDFIFLIGLNLLTIIHIYSEVVWLILDLFAFDFLAR